MLNGCLSFLPFIFKKNAIEASCELYQILKLRDTIKSDIYRRWIREKLLVGMIKTTSGLFSLAITNFSSPHLDLEGEQALSLLGFWMYSAAFEKIGIRIQILAALYLHIMITATNFTNLPLIIGHFTILTSSVPTLFETLRTLQQPRS